jgi:hypothetical protein
MTTVIDLMDKFLLYFDRLGNAIVGVDEFKFVLLNIHLLKDRPEHVRPVERVVLAKQYIIRNNPNIDAEKIDFFI